MFKMILYDDLKDVTLIESRLPVETLTEAKAFFGIKCRDRLAVNQVFFRKVEGDLYAVYAQGVCRGFAIFK